MRRSKLQSDGGKRGGGEERWITLHCRATEEGEEVLRNGAVVLTTPFLRTENPSSVTVAAMVLHCDGEGGGSTTGKILWLSPLSDGGGGRCS